MPSQTPPSPLSLLVSPYTALKDIAGGKAQLKAEGRHPGSLLVWRLADGIRSQDIPVVRDRPGGLPLIAVLPPPSSFPPEGALSRLMALCRPQSILPYHDTLAVEELVWALTRPPEDLPVEVTEYLAWRGIPIDRETASLIRKTVELSADLRSISSLARSLYLSRRALGGDSSAAASRYPRIGCTSRGCCGSPYGSRTVERASSRSDSNSATRTVSR